MPSPLKQLSNLIAASVDQIDAACEAKGLQFPSLDEPFSFPSEAARNLPDVLPAIDVIIAAASQLIATTKPPIPAIVEFTTQAITATSLGVVNEASIAEAIREGGPQGLHVKDIGKKTGLDPERVARILRMLASNHIFRETTPDVFTHNRLSSVIDTGKPFEVVKKDPAGKHDGTMGVCAMVGQMHDEGLKSLAVLWDTLRDPKFGHSQEPNEAAFSKAFNTDKSFFEWFELPGNEHRFRRTSVLMDGTSRLNPPGTILKGFDFGALPEGARVVDVAGGIGSVSLAIAQAHPKINITLEDRPQVILEAQKFWKANLPEALDTGRVRLIAADMFSAQSDIAAQPEIFIIRQIMHDWSDLYSIRILKCLRDAAGPNTRLLVVDNVLSYACAQTSNEVAIKGAELPAAPAPLLPNFGTARSWPYVMDVMMMIWQNGQERTLLHYANILKSTGWELKEIRRAMGSGLGHLVAVPV